MSRLPRLWLQGCLGRGLRVNRLRRLAFRPRPHVWPCSLLRFSWFCFPKLGFPCSQQYICLGSSLFHLKFQLETFTLSSASESLYFANTAWNFTGSFARKLTNRLFLNSTSKTLKTYFPSTSKASRSSSSALISA